MTLWQGSQWRQGLHSQLSCTGHGELLPPWARCDQCGRHNRDQGANLALCHPLVGHWHVVKLEACDPFQCIFCGLNSSSINQVMNFESCEQLSYVTNNMKHIIIEINQGAHHVQLSCGYYTRLQYLVDIHSFLLFRLWTTLFCADTIGWIVTSQAHISSQFLIRTKEHLIFSWSWWTV